MDFCPSKMYKIHNTGKENYSFICKTDTDQTSLHSSVSTLFPKYISWGTTALSAQKVNTTDHVTKYNSDVSKILNIISTVIRRNVFCKHKEIQLIFP